LFNRREGGAAETKDKKFESELEKIRLAGTTVYSFEIISREEDS
jgi:hypothetical protein